VLSGRIKNAGAIAVIWSRILLGTKEGLRDNIREIGPFLRGPSVPSQRIGSQEDVAEEGPKGKIPPGHRAPPGSIQGMPDGRNRPRKRES